MNIVAIHLEPGGVGWHRCWNWTTALKKRGHNVKHRPHAGSQFDWAEIDRLLDGADVVITGRMAHAQVFAALLAGRDKYHYKLVVDTDDHSDDIPNFNYAHPDYHPGTNISRLVRTELRTADLVTVSTEPLAEWARKYSGHVVVIPNVVDPLLHEKGISRNKEARHVADIRIYWGGGGGHYGDLLTIKKPMLKIFHERPEVKLVFSNFLPDWAADLPAFRAFMIRFAHFNAYPKVLKWLCADVAIAPLVDNIFNRCKSHVKYLDYGMAGIPAIYQRLEPYKDAIGLKAETEDEWYESIIRLLDDARLRDAISMNAKEDILEKWTIDRHIDRYEAMLQELVDRKTPEFNFLQEGVPCQTLQS